MNIDESSRNWIALGKEDPLWAVLTDPKKKGNQWQEAEFFETGKSDIRGAMERLRSLNLVIQTGRALDFGCGVGRLSQALADYFETVDGVDISETMVEKARQLNRHGQKVTYHVNVREDLNAFSANSFDFIYSFICLQHIPTPFQRNYVSGFLRLLKPHGIAYFQTIHATSWRKLIPNWAVEIIRKAKHGGKPFIPMYGLPPSQLQEIIKKNGCVVRSFQSGPFPGHESRWASDLHIVERK